LEVQSEGQRSRLAHGRVEAVLDAMNEKCGVDGVGRLEPFMKNFVEILRRERAHCQDAGVERDSAWFGFWTELTEFTE
jgi:hypothetical protein